MVDSYRDLLTGAMDVYLSTVSNRTQRRDEAADARRDDLPAAHALTGFFGQNFGWLVRHIDSLWAFLVVRRRRHRRCRARSLFVWFRRSRFLD